MRDTLDAAATPVAPNRRRRLVGVSALLGVLLLVVVAVTAMPGVRRGLIDPAGRAAEAGVTEVGVIDDFWEYFAYAPSVIEVPVGTEVTWNFDSRAPHDIVFDDVASELLTEGSWSRTFDAPGSYPYVCSIHDNMAGRVEVTAS